MPLFDLHRNIALKFIAYLMFLSVIPLLALGITSYHISRTILQAEAQGYTLQLLRNQRDYLDLQLEQVEALLANIAGVETILQALGDPRRRTDVYTRLATQARIGYILNNYSNLKGLISIDIFTLDGDHYHVGDTLDVGQVDTTAMQRLMQSALDSDRLVLWAGVERNVNTHSTHKQVITATKVLRRMNRETLAQEPVALLLANYSVKELYDRFQRIDLGENAYIQVVDQWGRLIYHPDPARIGSRIDAPWHTSADPEVSLTATIAGQPYAINRVAIPRNGWYLESIIPHRTLSAKAVQIQYNTALILVACFGMVTLVALLYSRRVVQPIRAIIESFKQLQSNRLDRRARLVVRGRDEIGELTHWFNAFMDNLAVLEAREAQLRTLIDAIPDVVCFKDGDGRWLEASAFVIRLFGLEGVAYQGKTDAELAECNPSYRATFQRCEETDELAWQRGEPSRGDEHILQPDGIEEIFDVIKIPRFDDQGCRHSLVVVGRDVTDRQRAEAELRQRDRLLQATADALTQLLSGNDLEETVGAALATLGRAVAADRAYIFENHPDPDVGAPLMSQRYEWCAAAALAQINNPDLQNVSYDACCPRWYSTLAAGASITGLVQEFPENERADLTRQAIRSLLVLPIQIEDQFWGATGFEELRSRRLPGHRQAFWGFIGFDDCHTDRVWSPVEQNILRTAAAALGHAYIRRRAEAARRASEQRFRAMIEHAPDGIVLFNQAIRYASPAVERLLGYTPEETMGIDPDSLTHPEDLPSLLSLLNHLLGQPGRVISTQYRFRHKDGSWRWLESTISNLLAEPSVGALVFNFRDITERHRAEARQRLAAAVFEAAREAIFVADADGKILAVNPAFTTLTGYAEAQVRGQSPRLLWADRQPEAYFEALERTAAREGVWQGEFWTRRQDGERRAVLVSLCVVRDAADRITHYVGVATDITSQKITEQRIERLAYYDALTDLPNRALLAQRAELALALAARSGHSLAVLFLDLDRFKEVNDALGHGAGDTLLMQVAARLQALVRAEDTVCRLGGDEFVLLLPEANQEGAMRVADKVLSALRQPFVVADHALNATASVGIALYPHDGADFADLLKNADVALYRAKHAGRNTRLFYDRAMNAATLTRMVLEAELRQALTSGQLRAYYQPKVRLADGALAGAEALVRWEHPDRGLIPPDQFITVAETSDLIVALGDWMLNEVCRQLAAWRSQGGPALTVAVNLAARHFRQPELADRIRGLLEVYDLPAQALELELTESALLDASADTVATLRQLEQLKVGLALDDFGTGYSCLSYLKHLPLDALKIDQSFVRDLVTDPDDRAIAATIVALGHHLELAVVAEGVETEDQRRFLLEQGCDMAQGYLFDRPLSAEVFAADWLALARGSETGLVPGGPRLPARDVAKGDD